MLKLSIQNLSNFFIEPKTSPSNLKKIKLIFISHMFPMEHSKTATSQNRLSGLNC